MTDSGQVLNARSRDFAVIRVTGARANTGHDATIRSGAAQAGNTAMRKLIIAAATMIAAITLTAAIDTGAFALHRSSQAEAQQATSQHNLAAHMRTVPLWMPG
jgi:hypothetical protein